MKNFVDFIVDAAKDSELGKELTEHVAKSDHQTISDWFKGKGYDVHKDECQKLTENKDDLKNHNLGLYPY